MEPLAECGLVVPEVLSASRCSPRNISGKSYRYAASPLRKNRTSKASREDLSAVARTQSLENQIAGDLEIGGLSVHSLENQFTVDSETAGQSLENQITGDLETGGFSVQSRNQITVDSETAGQSLDNQITGNLEIGGFSGQSLENQITGDSVISGQSLENQITGDLEIGGLSVQSLNQITGDSELGKLSGQSTVGALNAGETTALESIVFESPLQKSALAFEGSEIAGSISKKLGTPARRASVNPKQPIGKLAYSASPLRQTAVSVQDLKSSPILKAQGTPGGQALIGKLNLESAESFSAGKVVAAATYTASPLRQIDVFVQDVETSPISKAQGTPVAPKLLNNKESGSVKSIRKSVSATYASSPLRQASVPPQMESSPVLKPKGTPLGTARKRGGIHNMKAMESAYTASPLRSIVAFPVEAISVSPF